MGWRALGSWFRRVARFRRVPRLRLGLRWQIALLGTGGVLLVGGIYLSGLQSQQALQREADSATRLKILIDDVAQNFLRVDQADTAFLLRRSETLIADHEAIVLEMGAALTGIEAIVAPLPAEAPVQRAGSLRPALNNYVTRYHNVVAAQRTVGFDETSGRAGDLREAV